MGRNLMETGGEKRRLTVIKLEIAMDNQVVLGEFNQLCVPLIKKACIFGGERFAPEVLVESIEYKELEVSKR